ncbi:MAG: transcription-repair coupling factor [Candidatus Omnitrophica bacterium 4484_70.1]|nr:MAG: transcription-repair coupling factor [Candidatus Omnitrophica bacterium 4484_70.1]
MIDTLKLYPSKEISQDEVVEGVLQLGYVRVEEVSLVGDFSLKGENLEIFPSNFNLPVRVEWEFALIKKIYSFDKSINRKILEYDFLIILPVKRRGLRRYQEDIPLDVALNIKKGDYVVHNQYGIGRFLGLKKIKVKDKEDYFLAIEYKDKEILYISREDIHKLHKYISFSARAPKLTKLGGREWIRTKRSVEKGVREFAWELLKIEAERRLKGGFKFSPDTEWQKIFEEKFSYPETPDQKKALEEIKKDMESSSCMDRLVCGDTGYGKTEVAMRAAFKAVMDNKQVAFLVPTTVLAYQHYENLKERVKDFPIVVEMLSRFCTKKEQRIILEGLRKGKVDIVVGTHRLLSGDVRFKDLGLLIIDEEQRFGVAHKERIKKIKTGVDVLTLTATPIPRTLYMGLVGLKEISLIETPPQERLAVKTKILEFSHSFIKEAILQELKRGGQIFFIHNRISTLPRIENILRRLLPSLKIGVIHASMPARIIEKIMLEFIDKKLECLLSTAIVESGIDIPSANTIFVNDAHTFGLADLHQLRGRVGRFNIQAYAYFLVPKFSLISREAKERLKLLEEFSHLGAGFKIAQSDLELRGAGNLLGREQHGFVSLVGFDLYCRLLKKEIEYLKDEIFSKS